MSLTSFVELKHVKEKLNNEFKIPQKTKYIKIFRKTQQKEVLKNDIGFFQGIFRDDCELISDSNGRIKQITSFKDVLRFLTFRSYKTQLCWVYLNETNFESFFHHLPKDLFDSLITTGRIDYMGHHIEISQGKYFKIQNKKQNHSYKFLNLYPFFTVNFKDAADTLSNFDENFDVLFSEINFPINNNGEIIQSCIKCAEIVKSLGESIDLENDFQYNPKIINKPLTSNYMLVGSAFDYLLRFYIEAHNQKVITRPWIAYDSLTNLEETEREQAESIIEAAKKTLSAYLKNKEMTDDLIKSAIFLAKLESVYRAGINWENINFEIDPRDILDLKNLLNGVPENIFTNKRISILNPRFGLASVLVGGADADILIDNTLIDIKTTNNPKFSFLYFRQLMGYVILQQLGLLYLNNIHRVDALGLYEDEDLSDLDQEFLNVKIERIGIYYSRFNYLYTFNLDDITPYGKIDWSILSWFEDEAYKSYQPIDIKKYFGKIIERKLKFKHITLDEILYPAK